jgi:hypothetical protein
MVGGFIQLPPFDEISLQRAVATIGPISVGKHNLDLRTYIFLMQSLKFKRH